MIITLVFLALMAFIFFTRIPLGFVMMLCGIGGIAAIHPRGLPAGITIAEQEFLSLATNFQFSVLPMFILMGVFVVKAGLADDLFEAAYRWMGWRRGGLGMATVLASGGFAALCASSSAAAATMAKVSLPAMRKFNYDPGFATGIIAAGGTMGILIPPSSALIIYGLLAEQNIGDLFVAGIVPGLMQIACYVLVVAIVTRFLPNWGPAGEKFSLRDRLVSLGKVWGVLVLFLLVMAGIVTGFVTTTEAGGIGAAGALLFAILRRRMSPRIAFESLVEAASISAMIFLVAAGAMVLNQFINLSGLPLAAVAFIEGLNVSPMMVIIMLLVFYVVLGCFLDGFAMIFLTVPVFVPVVAGLGFDLVWWGIVMVVVVEISLITPPIGLNVFVLKALAPDVPVQSIFKGVMPFLLIDILRVVALVAVPGIALWLVHAI